MTDQDDTEDTTPARPKLARPITIPTRDAPFDTPLGGSHGDEYVTTDDPEVASQYDARLWQRSVPGI